MEKNMLDGYSEFLMKRPIKKDPKILTHKRES